MGKGFLTALLLLSCAGGLRAAQPVMFEKAAGSWNGRVYSAPGRFDVSVSLTKEAYLRGVFQAIGMGNNKNKLNGEFFPAAGEGACYSVKAKTLGTPPLEFKVAACPAGPETLRLSSAMGSGKLSFSDNFSRCDFTFGGLFGRVNGILYRATREKAGPKAGEAKKDNKPPLPAPKFQMRKP